MAERLICWPATRVGEKLRRLAAARRRKRRRLILLTLGGTAIALVTLTALWKAPALLVWNASASAPVGLYEIEHHSAIRRGDMVLARMPASLRALAAARAYLPASIPLVKRVAAVGGDRVCAAGTAVRINRRPVAARFARDPAGRPMPWWTGCRTLQAGDFFLLTDNPRSFDGRYFGITQRGDLLGRAILLWQERASSRG